MKLSIYTVFVPLFVVAIVMVIYLGQAWGPDNNPDAESISANQPEKTTIQVTEDLVATTQQDIDPWAHVAPLREVYEVPHRSQSEVLGKIRFRFIDQEGNRLRLDIVGIFGGGGKGVFPATYLPRAFEMLISYGELEKNTLLKAGENYSIKISEGSSYSFKVPESHSKDIITHDFVVTDRHQKVAAKVSSLKLSMPAGTYDTALQAGVSYVKVNFSSTNFKLLPIKEFALGTVLDIPLPSTAQNVWVYVGTDNRLIARHNHSITTGDNEVIINEQMTLPVGSNVLKIERAEAGKHEIMAIYDSHDTHMPVVWDQLIDGASLITLPSIPTGTYIIKAKRPDIGDPVTIGTVVVTTESRVVELNGYTATIN